MATQVEQSAAAERVLREHFGHLIGSDDYMRRAAVEVAEAVRSARCAYPEWCAGADYDDEEA